MSKIPQLICAFALALMAPALALAQTGAQTSAPVGNAAVGASKTAMCTGCHGIVGWRTAYPEVYKVPKIGGQHRDYIIKALTEYKNGERSHPTMRAIATSLSEQDMADLAAYYSGSAPVTASK